MESGYSMFYSVENPDKYLGFNRNGKPINYSNSLKIDKQCRKIFKRVTGDSSNDVSTSTVSYEQISPASNNNHHSHHHQRHKSSTRVHQRTHSNRIETSKPRNASQHSSSKRNKLQTQTPSHPVRHRHDEHHRFNHSTISNKDNKLIDSSDNTSNTKQLGNEDLNAIYNRNNDSGGEQGKQTAATPHIRHHHKKPTQSVSKLLRGEPNLDHRQGSSLHFGENSPNLTNDSVGKKENNNNDTNNINNNKNTSNCTYSTKIIEDETDDKHLRGRKIVKANNAHANEKPSNNNNIKCNNNNRRHRKNNGNGTHSRKPSQKSSSHKKSTGESLN
jgi:hypothetical protein